MDSGQFEYSGVRLEGAFDATVMLFATTLDRLRRFLVPDSTPEPSSMDSEHSKGFVINEDFKGCPIQ